MSTDDLSSLRMLRLPAILDLIGVSKATLYRWVDDGSFPSPVKLGPNSVAWPEAAVREWLESRQPVTLRGDQEEA